MNPLQPKRILVTGGAGFISRAVCRLLWERSTSVDQFIVPRHRDYDLTIETEVVRLHTDARPDVAIHLTAEVGGIGPNMAHPGWFFIANMATGLHLVEHGRHAGINKFVHGSTSVLIRSLRRFLSMKRISGTAIPNRRTPRIAS